MKTRAIFIRRARVSPGTRTAPDVNREGFMRAAQHGYGLIELLITTAVMIVVLSLTVQTIIQLQRNHGAQTRMIDTQYNARASMDIIVRLLRSAQSVDPDPDGNGVFDSIAIQGDWNPPDGSADDPYESMTLTTTGGLMFKQEPSDQGAVPFADRIESMTFTYFDTNDVAIPDAAGQPGQIALVRLVLVTTAAPMSPAMTVSTAVALRPRQ